MKIKNKRMIIFYIAISLFIILTIMVFTKFSDPLDQLVDSFIIDIRNTKLTNFMIGVTNMGGAHAFCAITILLLIIIKKKKIPIMITINLISVALISQIFKFLFHRDRPMGVFLTNANGYSYPSGHTMISCAFYIFIIILICKHMKNKLLKTLVIIIGFMLLLFIGFSRIYLGVHFTTDVLGGILLAMAYLCIFLKLKDKIIGDKK